jgi:outer membrane biosynthesis protein TonB
MGSVDQAQVSVQESNVTQVPQEGDGEMAKTATKVMKGRKRKEEPVVEKKEKKPELKKEPKKTEVKKEVKKEKAQKTEKAVSQKAVREKKPTLKVNAPKGVTVEETKYLTVASVDKKRMWIRGSTVGLTEKISGFKSFKAVSEEDAKKNHLGKTRMLGKVASQDELNEVVKKFFA